MFENIQVIVWQTGIISEKFSKYSPFKKLQQEQCQMV